MHKNDFLFRKNNDKYQNNFEIRVTLRFSKINPCKKYTFY